MLSMLFLSCSRQPLSEETQLLIEPQEADFGTIQASDPVAYHNVSLSIINLGKQPLYVEDVELPEGFSYIMVPRTTVAGGGRATLKISLARRKFSGVVSETAYVVSNDPARPRASIKLEANIVGEPAADIPSPTKGSDISLDHKSFDFGTLARYQAVEHSFPIKNLGSKTLKIHRIETNCLCATARPTMWEVPPGGSAEIIAKLEPYKYEGNNLRKTLTVFTNDPAEPTIGLTIIANVVDVARIEPKVILLPDIQAGRPASATAEVIQEGLQPLLIERIETSSPKISVSHAPLQTKRKGHLLTVTVAPDMPEGQFNELVTVFTNYKNYAKQISAAGPKTEIYKNYRRLKLPVKGSVKGAVSVTPWTINFGSGEPGETMRRKLIVSTRAADSFEIESLSLADPCLRASFAPIEPGKEYKITVEFIPAGDERQVEDRLVIKTTGKELVVPVFAVVKPRS